MAIDSAWKPDGPTATQMFGLTVIFAGIVCAFITLYNFQGMLSSPEAGRMMALCGIISVAGFVVAMIGAFFERPVR